MIDNILNTIQLYSYKLPTVKIGNWIMDFREKYTLNKRQLLSGGEYYEKQRSIYRNK